MTDLKITQQKSSDKQWRDEAGNFIPYDRTKGSERANERRLPSLAKERLALRKSLEAHKKKML